MIFLHQKAFQDTGIVPVLQKAHEPEDNVSVHTISSLFCEYLQQRKEAAVLPISSIILNNTWPQSGNLIGTKGKGGGKGEMVFAIVYLKCFLIYFQRSEAVFSPFWWLIFFLFVHSESVGVFQNTLQISQIPPPSNSYLLHEQVFTSAFISLNLLI